jgi:hypothetical protein
VANGRFVGGEPGVPRWYRRSLSPETFAEIRQLLLDLLKDLPR